MAGHDSKGPTPRVRASGIRENHGPLKANKGQRKEINL